MEWKKKKVYSHTLSGDAGDFIVFVSGTCSVIQKKAEWNLVMRSIT